MITLALGLGTLGLLLWGAGAFSRADVRTVKAAFGWIAALAGRGELNTDPHQSSRPVGAE